MIVADQASPDSPARKPSAALVDPSTHASGLGPGEVLADDPAGRQIDGIVGARHLSRLSSRSGDEARLSIRMEEAASFEETGCPSSGQGQNTTPCSSTTRCQVIQA